MALRIRQDGAVLCAAMHAEKSGDTYIDDTLHYHLSAERKVLCTTPADDHAKHGKWWWAWNAPEGVDPFYLEFANKGRP